MDDFGSRSPAVRSVSGTTPLPPQRPRGMRFRRVPGWSSSSAGGPAPEHPFTVPTVTVPAAIVITPTVTVTPFSLSRPSLPRPSLSSRFHCPDRYCPDSHCPDRYCYRRHRAVTPPSLSRPSLFPRLLSPARRSCSDCHCHRRPRRYHCLSSRRPCRRQKDLVNLGIEILRLRNTSK